MSTRDSPRKLLLGTFLSLLFAISLFAMFIGRPNQGLLAMSAAARLLFCMGAAAGAVMALKLIGLAADPQMGLPGWIEARSRGGSQWQLRLFIAMLTLSLIWGLAWFAFLSRVALLLDGPVSRESARLQRPLALGSPVWCAYYTTVRTQSGDKGSVCMERPSGRSELVPLLGCVPLDSPAIVEIRRTFLGPVGSLVKVTDVGRCASKARPEDRGAEKPRNSR